MTYKDVKKLVEDKLINKTNDTPYEYLSEILFGEGNCFNESEVRKRMYGMKRLIEIIESDITNTIDSEAILKELEDKKIELQKERYKLSDQRIAFNKMVRNKARQEEINEIIEKCISDGNLPKLEAPKPDNKKYNKKSMLVSLNDLHYGQDIINFWNVYNSEICQQRIAEYLDKIIEIQAEQNAEECVVWANGDLISGNIHNEISITNKENVIEQLTQVSELIASFLACLSNYFNKVRFVSVAGNHSRLGKKEDSLKDERLDDIVEWYLKARLQNIPKIKFDEYKKIDTTMYVVKVQGLNYVGVHGDYDYSDTSIRNLVSMVEEPVYAILSGHLHHNKIDTVQGIKTIMGGSMIGMDSYCIQKRIIGVPEQLVCICTQDGLKCTYNVELKK